MPERLKIALPIKKRLCHSSKKLSKSGRASKLHHWYKSYGHFSEGVDFAYWWSCIGNGLRLQPVQKACFIIIINYFLSSFVLLIHTCFRTYPTLEGQEWVNDEVINDHLKLMVSQAKRKVYQFSTYFYQKLADGKKWFQASRDLTEKKADLPF